MNEGRQMTKKGDGMNDTSFAIDWEIPAKEIFGTCVFILIFHSLPLPFLKLLSPDVGLRSKGISSSTVYIRWQWHSTPLLISSGIQTIPFTFIFSITLTSPGSTLTQVSTGRAQQGLKHLLVDFMQKRTKSLSLSKFLLNFYDPAFHWDKEEFPLT